MISKKKLQGLLAFGLCALFLPFAAQADLVITNDTDYPSASKINGARRCSSLWLGKERGITKAHSQNSIADYIIDGSCIGTPPGKLCMADVFMSEDCSSKPIATVWLTADRRGIDSFVNYKVDNFYLDNTPHGSMNIRISGGPN